MHKDTIIIGAGIVGICIARAFKAAYPDQRVLVLDKEAQIAEHASGRNSGVLHAGFYYTSDSMKARFSQQGNQMLRAYCEAHRIPINSCGKLVPANSDEEHVVLKTLYERGLTNGVPLNLVSADEARSIEPRVHCSHEAIFSPTTASVNPTQVMLQLLKDAVNEGIEFAWDEAFIKPLAKDQIQTSRRVLSHGLLVNAAGLYADRIAHAYGVGHEYTMLPFKGVYLLGNQHAKPTRVHVYPVPNMAQPFLGVHVTLSPSGGIKLGPTAMPAFWREHYRGFSRFRWGECATVMRHELALLLHSPFGFRGLAWRELRMMQKSALVKSAQRLVKGLDVRDFNRWGRPGIRAQLLNKKTRNLVNDFTVIKKDNSWHLLNVVSPAFTCAMALANDMVPQLSEVTH